MFSSGVDTRPLLRSDVVVVGRTVVVRSADARLPPGVTGGSLVPLLEIPLDVLFPSERRMQANRWRNTPPVESQTAAEWRRCL